MNEKEMEEAISIFISNRRVAGETAMEKKTLLKKITFGMIRVVRSVFKSLSSLRACPHS